MDHIRIVILPGNGCDDVQESNWYGWLKTRLLEEGFNDVILKNMPDPLKARRSIWVPFLHEMVGTNGPLTVVVGHSSGAECAMRYAEKHQLYGLVLVSAYWTPLGNKLEKASGYFDGPWEWEAIRGNTNPLFGVVQFHSSDDPWIPMREAEHIANNLVADRYFFDDKSHFFEPFEEIVTVLKLRLRRFLR